MNIKPDIHGLLYAATTPLLILTVSACSVWPADEGAAGGPVQDEAQVLAYWTVERMQAAADIDSPADFRPLAPPLGGDDYGYIATPRPYKAGAVSRVTGVLFSHNPVVNQDTHCSAAVISSRSKSVIVTAAHCFISYNPVAGGKTWSELMLFVPAYDGVGVKDLHHRAPFGVWPLHRAYVTRKIADLPIFATSARDDLGLASVYPQQGQRLEMVVGDALEPLINDDEVFAMGDLFGYPSGRYGGYTQYRCATVLSENAYNGIESPNCGIVGGNSGGPVVVGNKIVAVVHGREQTRLRSDTYPSLAEAADGGSGIGY